MKNDISKTLSSAVVSSIASGAYFCLMGNVMPAVIPAICLSAVAGNAFYDAITGVLNCFGHKENKEDVLLNDVFIRALSSALDSAVSMKKIKQYKTEIASNVCKNRIKEINNELKYFIKNQSGELRIIIEKLDSQKVFHGDTSIVENNLKKYIEEKFSGCDNELVSYVTREIDFNKLREHFFAAISEEPKAHFAILTLILKNQDILEIKLKKLDVVDEKMNNLSMMLAEIIRFLEERENFLSAIQYALTNKDIAKIYNDSLLEKYGRMKVDFLEGGPQDDQLFFDMKTLYWPLKLKKNNDSHQEEDWSSLAGNFAHPKRYKKEQLKVYVEKKSIGRELQENSRLVILGEAGAGKSTLTAWLVIAELLRRNDDPLYKKFPDIEELSSVKSRLPVIIQCNAIKDCLAEDREADFNDILDRYVKDIFSAQAVDKSVIKSSVRSFLVENLNQGQVILIFDGLDEVQSEQKKENLIDLIERLTQRHASIPIIMTSRIEDYNERIQSKLKISGFKHVKISSLSLDERDKFVDHWCHAKGIPQSELDETVPQIKHSIRTLSHLKERTKNIFILVIVTHLYLKGSMENLSNDGLLFHETAKCFICRKNRADLNRIRVFLGYIAYQMRKERTVSIDIEDIIFLFEEENRFFSKDTKEWLLKSRKTGLIIENDGIYRFSHDFFCDYFAGSAIKERKFPGYSRRKKAEMSYIIQALSGNIQKEQIVRDKYEYIVAREWQTPIKYCLNICDDTDKEQCLSRMINTDDDENPQKTDRARSVMAASCLKEARKDENVEEEVGVEIIGHLIKNIRDEDTRFDTKLTSVAKGVWQTDWRDILEKTLIENFIIFDGVLSINFGSFFAMLSCMEFIEQSNADINEESEHEQLTEKRKELRKRREGWIEKLIHDLSSDEPETVIRAALPLLELAFQKILRFDLRINDALFELTKGNIGCSINEKAAVTRAAVWVLYWLHFNYAGEEDYCQPSEEQIGYLYSVVESSESDKYAVSRSIDLLGILQVPDRMKYRFTDKDRLYNWAILADTGGRRELSQKFQLAANGKLIENLVIRLDDEEKKVRERAALVLGRFNIWKEKAVQPLLDLLHEEGMDDETKIELIEYLGCIRCSDAIAGLIEELENEDSEVRFYAMLALVGLGDSRAFDLLLAKLDHPQAEIRQYIATILGTLNDLRVPGVLTKLLKDNNDYVKKKCREILKRICHDLLKKEEYISVLDILKSLLESEPEDIELLQIKYDCFFNTANYDNALEVVKQMITSDSKTLSLLMRIRS
jgi:hypothetical protein